MCARLRVCILYLLDKLGGVDVATGIGESINEPVLPSVRIVRIARILHPYLPLQLYYPLSPFMKFFLRQTFPPFFYLAFFFNHPIECLVPSTKSFLFLFLSFFASLFPLDELFLGSQPPPFDLSFSFFRDPPPGLSPVVMVTRGLEPPPAANQISRLPREKRTATLPRFIHRLCTFSHHHNFRPGCTPIRSPSHHVCCDLFPLPRRRGG